MGVGFGYGRVEYCGSVVCTGRILYDARCFAKEGAATEQSDAMRCTNGQNAEATTPTTTQCMRLLLLIMMMMMMLLLEWLVYMCTILNTDVYTH